jgi:hypothetical protein
MVSLRMPPQRNSSMRRPGRGTDASGCARSDGKESPGCRPPAARSAGAEARTGRCGPTRCGRAAGSRPPPSGRRSLACAGQFPPLWMLPGYPCWRPANDVPGSLATLAGARPVSRFRTLVRVRHASPQACRPRARCGTALPCRPIAGGTRRIAAPPQPAKAACPIRIAETILPQGLDCHASRPLRAARGFRVYCLGR